MPAKIGTRNWSIEVVHGRIIYNGAEYTAFAWPDRSVIEVTDTVPLGEQLTAVAETAGKVRELDGADALNVLLGEPSILKKPSVLLRRPRRSSEEQPPRQTDGEAA